jgi:hypothetical protein
MDLIKPEDIPVNATEFIAYICNDVRKRDCPFYNHINIETNYVSFDQGFCVFNNRKDMSLKSCEGK